MGIKFNIHVIANPGKDIMKKNYIFVLNFIAL